MDASVNKNNGLALKTNRNFEKLRKEQEKCREMVRREEAYCKTNTEKFDKKWCEIFTQIKNDELKFLVEESSKVFEHILNIKDDQIDLLLHQMNFANEQYLQMNFYVTESMDEHILLFRKNLLELKKEYEARLGAKLAEIECERKEIEERELEDTTQFEQLMKDMEEYRNGEEDEINDHYLSICDEELKKSDSKCDGIKVQMGQEIDEIANEIIDVIDTYLKETSKRKSEVKTGLDQNRKTQDSIAELQQQISNSYKILDEKKARLAEIETEYNEQIPNLEREKSEALRQLDAVKLDYEKQKKFYENQLKELVVNSNQEISRLKFQSK